MKNQKGITLIALVITIIVLLILAGITIAMLTGENGLLSKSRQAVTDNAIGATKDEIGLAAQTAMATFLEDKYSNTSSTKTTATAQSSVLDAIDTQKTTLAREGCTITVDKTATTKQITITKDDKSVKGSVGTNGTLEW